MNHGDEIALSFDAARLPELAVGWTRTFFLKADGWCKDMDPYTASPDTVTPLPFHGMGAYPAEVEGRRAARPDFDDWNATFNTRVIHGHWDHRR